MRLRFTKMHGLGNDFLVLNGCDQPLPEDGPPLSVAELRRLGDRHFGVGFDQMLVVQPPRHEGVDFRYRIFNADGSEVSQCGNGARCFARFVRDEGLTDKHRIRVETAAGEMTLNVTDDGLVTVDMGAPLWAPEAIPFLAKQEAGHLRAGVGQQRLRDIGGGPGQPASGDAHRERGQRPGGHPGPRAGTPRAVPRAGQRGLHADRQPPRDPSAGVRARRRRDPGLRLRRLRRGGVRPAPAVCSTTPSPCIWPAATCRSTTTAAAASG